MPVHKLVSPMIASLQAGSLGAVASQNSMTKPRVMFVISSACSAYHIITPGRELCELLWKIKHT